MSFTLNCLTLANDGNCRRQKKETEDGKLRGTKREGEKRHTLNRHLYLCL